MTGQGDGIAGLAALDQHGDRFEYQAVIVAVEILGRDPIGDLIPGRGIEHQAAKHRLLCFDGMRRQLEAVAGAQGSIDDASGHAPRSRRRYSSATIETSNVTSTSVCRCSWT